MSLVSIFHSSLLSGTSALLTSCPVILPEQLPVTTSSCSLPSNPSRRCLAHNLLNFTLDVHSFPPVTSGWPWHMGCSSSDSHWLSQFFLSKAQLSSVKMAPGANLGLSLGEPLHSCDIYQHPRAATSIMPSLVFPFELEPSHSSSSPKH